MRYLHGVAMLHACWLRHFALKHARIVCRPLTSSCDIFWSVTFQVLFEVGSTSTMGQVDPQHLAKTTASYAFRSAALRPDGTMGLEEFHRWHSG